MAKDLIHIDYSRKRIKGKIAEVIFEQMIREEKRYAVIPFGYEHTVPTLAQYRHILEVPEVLDNISDAPDFALISEYKKKLYLVEVKYQTTLDLEKIIQFAEKLLRRWNSPWIFVATPENFFCSPCHTVTNTKNIKPLPKSWVSRERQRAYRSLLNEFRNNSHG